MSVAGCKQVARASDVLAAWLAIAALAGVSRMAQAAEPPRVSAGPPHAIFVMKLDGSQVRPVVRIEAFHRLGAPRWSHDARRLLFQAEGGQPGRCLFVDVSGRNLIDLGHGTAPDWAADDKQVAYQAPNDSRNLGQQGIWVQNADGKGASWLRDGRAPRWSPDGTRLAILGPLRVVDLVEGVESPVFSSAAGIGETLGCAWSPDGLRLAAVVLRNQQRELVLVNLGESTRRVQSRWQGALHESIDWSPDGKSLAVSVRDANSGEYHVGLLKVDAHRPPELIAGQQGDNREPAFSPDGSHLAIASTRRDAAAVRPGDS